MQAGKKDSMKPTIGIIGGAGPLATLDVEKKILSAVQKLVIPLIDQDYYNLVVFNYSETFDRNDSVFFGHPDPLNQYIQYISSISTLGVDLILLACNTAHIYFEILNEKATVPLISIIEKAVDYLRTNFPACTKVGLISTRATIDKKLYHNHLARFEIEAVTPEIATQNLIMEAVYLIKAGIELDHQEPSLVNSIYTSYTNIEKINIFKKHPHKHILLQEHVPNPSFIIKRAVEELKRKGCKHIIFGCTELPLVIPYLKEDHALHLIDPNTIIAEAIVTTLQEMENQHRLNLRISNNKRKYV